MEISAIIFDLDGTLLDTLADIAEAANRVLEARRLPTHDLPDYRRFVGNGADVLMERALPLGHRDADTIAATGAEFRRIYSTTWNHSTRPYPEVDQLLETLKQRDVPMAVLSNKPHANTLTCVNEFFNPLTFAVVLGQRDGVPCKPDPSAALEIAQLFGKPPARCAFVGDSDVDMQTAVHAKMTGIGAAWGFRSQTELIESGACWTIQHPLELLEKPFASQPA